MCDPTSVLSSSFHYVNISVNVNVNKVGVIQLQDNQVNNIMHFDMITIIQII